VPRGPGSVESPGGFNRRLTLRLKIREVRVLTDVGDEGVGEESGEVLDELGWERSVARGRRRRAAGMIEGLDRGQFGLQRERFVSFSGGAAGRDYRSRYVSFYAAVRRRLRTIWSRIQRI
jgi:hypothetical protein